MITLTGTRPAGGRGLVRADRASPSRLVLLRLFNPLKLEDDDYFVKPAKLPNTNLTARNLSQCQLLGYGLDESMSINLDLLLHTVDYTIGGYLKIVSVHSVDNRMKSCYSISLYSYKYTKHDF